MMIDAPSEIANRINKINIDNETALKSSTLRTKTLCVVAEELIRMIKHDPENFKLLTSEYILEMGDDGNPIWINIDKLFNCAATTIGLLYTSKIDLIKNEFDFWVFEDVFGIEYEIKWMDSHYYFIKKSPTMFEYVRYNMDLYTTTDMLIRLCIPFVGFVMLYLILYYMGKYGVLKYVK